MNGRTFLDTNVLVYAIDSDEPDKQERARAVLTGIEADDLVLSSQVLGEFFVVATRKLARPISPDAAGEFVDRLARLEVVAIDAGLVKRAIAASIEWGLSYRDALIVRAAEAAGCERILSEDLAHGRRYGQVVIENPFR